MKDERVSVQKVPCFFLHLHFFGFKFEIDVEEMTGKI